MKIPIPILSALTTAAITVTACSTPPTVVDSGPAPAPSKASGSERKIMPVEVAESTIAAAKKFGAEQLDTVSAHAALTDGRPILVALPNGDNPTCHSALLVPGDEKPWILNSSSISSAGTAMERTLLQYGCGAGMEIPTPRVPVPVPILPLNTVARDAAKAQDVPFIYATCAGATVVLPDGAHGGVWHQSREGATVTGEALSRGENLVACGDGYGNGVTLPGQTPAPTEEGTR